MRELLRDIPPHEPPPGLVDRIEKSLMREKRQAVESPEQRERSGFGKIADAFKLGLSWPRYGLKGISGGTGVLKDSFSGINTVSYSLGPLREPARKGIDSIRHPKKPLWKIALSRLW